MNRTVLFLIICLIFFTACKRDRLHIDVDDISLSMNFYRMDSVFHQAKEADVDKYIDAWKSNHKSFLKVYAQNVIRIGNPESENFEENFKLFLNDSSVKLIAEESRLIFDMPDNIFADIEKAFKHYRYYYPKRTIPEIYTYLSGFNQNFITADRFMGIGIDNYLGRNCSFYKQLNIPKYLVHNMYPERIPIDCMKAWGFSNINYNDSVDNLLSQMIYQGQVMLFTKAMLPDVQDSLLFGFTSGQMEWCMENERHLWDYIIEKKFLFSKRTDVIRKFIGEAPFTSGLPKESPGRTGVWIGYRIMKKYFEKEKNLIKCLNNNNYQDILKKSLYKP